MKRLIACFFLSGALFAQTEWRRIGGSTFDAGLASPATGPVTAVWFSTDGGKLNVKTAAGVLWVSADLEKWTLAADADSPPKHLSAPSGLGTPETSMRTVQAPGGVIYALGFNLYRSEDNGASWINLTGFGGRPVIGPGQNDIAVSPRDPQNIIVGNAWGLWASHDGGLSWTGLNQNLPNLHIVEIGSADSAITSSLAVMGAMKFTPGTSNWELADASAGDKAALERATVSAKLRSNIRIIAGSGDFWYAGSVDSKLWISNDKKATWTLSPSVAGGPIEHIFVDPDRPRIAFAVASGKTRSILRTINGGQFWDDITGGLVDNPAHGIAADRTAGAVYVATDRGVFLARADLEALGPVSTWKAVPGLPSQPVLDLKLSGVHIYAAVDGYGLFVQSTPQLTGTLRLVSAADQTERAASPGSLFSVVGARVQSATSGPLQIPILAASGDESQIQVPFEATGNQLDLTLDQTKISLPLKSVSPAIFVDRDGAPMLLDAESGLMLEARSSLHARSRVQVLATGLGRTSPAWATAIPAPAENPPAVAAEVQAFLNGVALTVTRATLAPGYVGLYVVEVELPSILDSGAGELHLTVEGQESNQVRIMVQLEN